MFPIRDHNPSEKTPIITYLLIAVNVIVFISYLPIQDDELRLAAFWRDWAMIPGQVADGRSSYTLLTSMFLHGGFMHIAGNMLFLWIFGDNLEEEMGHLGFLIFYLAAGLGAGLTQVISDPASQVPVVGASGAIAGVMGGYLLLFPRARVDVLFIFVIFFKIWPIPAWIVLSVWFALQLLNGFSVDPSGGGVAYWAHAGGFLAGLILTLPVWLRRGAVAFWRQTDGHPPHPEAEYRLRQTSIPRVTRRK